MRAARRLPRQRQRDVDVPRPLRALRAAVDGRQRDRARRGGRRSRSPRSRRVPHAFDGLEFVEVATVTRIARRDRRATSSPTARSATSTSATRPGAARPRPRRGWPSCAPATGSCGSTRTRRPARSPPGPRVDALVAAGDLDPGAEAGVDAGRRVRPRRADGGQLRARRARAGAPPRRVGRDRDAGARPRRPGAVRGMKLSPTLDRPAHVSVRAPDEAKARLRADGVGPHRLRDRRAARGDAGVHPRGARRRRSSRSRPTRRPSGCPSCARRSPAGRRGGSASRWTRTREVAADARLQGGDLPPRAGARRRLSSRCPRPPTRSTSAARCSRARRCSSCRCARTPASCPTSTRCPRGPGARSALLWLNYPNNPTARDCAARASTSAPRRSRASTASCSASDEAYSEIYFGAEPPVSALQLADLTGVARVQHALQALLDARLPLGLRGRRPAS